MAGAAGREPSAGVMMNGAATNARMAEIRKGSVVVSPKAPARALHAVQHTARDTGSRRLALGRGWPSCTAAGALCQGPAAVVACVIRAANAHEGHKGGSPTGG